tara:strand:+ start:8392 stop:8775 length:384 start_codon:yes stop_codon:yes gene_type:complete
MLNIEKGTPVRVYKNLNLGNWTVQTKITGKGWRKAGGVDECHIFNATPVTSEKGQARIIAKGQREVIASIQGEWGGENTTDIATAPVHYNPFRRSDFHYKNGDSFTGCDVASFAKLAPVFNAYNGGK